MGLAGLHKESLDYDAAIEAYNKALKIWPGDFLINNNMAAMHLKFNQTSEALPYLNAALAARPDRTHIKRLFQLYYYQQGKSPVRPSDGP